MGRVDRDIRILYKNGSTGPIVVWGAGAIIGINPGSVLKGSAAKDEW